MATIKNNIEQGKRLMLAVTLTREYKYEYESRYSFYPETKFIYTFQDDDGNVYVWKTGCFIGYDITDEKGYCVYVPVYRGDKIEIAATVKEFSEYKGEPQVVLTRVKVKRIIERALTQEEKEEIKHEEQIASLNDGDEIYKMPYRQYKGHYADCETVVGSYDEETGTIEVIVREGRMKPSGVRGKRFHSYKVTHANGHYSTYRAVSGENALKQARKEFPNETFTGVCKFL